MSEDALDDVIDGNLSVDEDQGTTPASANKHGMAGVKPDGNVQSREEVAAGADGFVQGQLGVAAELLFKGKVEEARRAFGAATHTPQDETADSHQGAQWKGLWGTPCRDPIIGFKHWRNDKNITGREWNEGVQRTRDVYARFTTTVRMLGVARGLTDKAVASAMSSFNGR